MMFGFKKRILHVQIRNFEPLTDNNNPIERKKDLLEKIKKQIDVETIKKKCEKIFFSLKVTYYLNKNTKIEGQYIKDLDNMTKILSDTLTDYLTKQDKDLDNKTGLGLMRDDKDIHELHLVKKFVDINSQQGIDITLYKWANKKNLD